LAENIAQNLDLAKTNPARLAGDFFFRPAVRRGPCEPSNLGASAGSAHGPRLCAPGAGADTLLVFGVKKWGGKQKH
jgi:hypothetical protein